MMNQIRRQEDRPGIFYLKRQLDVISEINNTFRAYQPQMCSPSLVSNVLLSLGYNVSNYNVDTNVFKTRVDLKLLEQCLVPILDCLSRSCSNQLEVNLAVVGCCLQVLLKVEDSSAVGNSVVGTFAIETLQKAGIGVNVSPQELAITIN
ncbi:hypothetical protein [Roseivirga pacifica]|uniref:hypothetical protein n=1 Tax=Roseivirga pacifica TaxID=1267423 RepID=UPI00227B4FFD|nr:hypothetical protein [Roseivirga pacifica]